MTKYYILKDKKVIPCRNLDSWAKAFAKSDRRVAETRIEGGYISTVFLGINHDFGYGGGPPMLFETMIFGGPLDMYQIRCSTYEEAERQHAETVEMVKKGKLCPKSE